MTVIEGDFARWEREGLASSCDPDYDYLWRRSDECLALAVMLGMLWCAAMLGVLIWVIFLR
jgi:hypothetical protein